MAGDGSALHFGRGRVRPQDLQISEGMLGLDPDMLFNHYYKPIQRPDEGVTSWMDSEQRYQRDLRNAISQQLAASQKQPAAEEEPPVAGTDPETPFDPSSQQAIYDKAMGKARNRAMQDIGYAFKQEGANQNDYTSHIEEFLNRAARDAPKFQANEEGDYKAPDMSTVFTGGDAFAEQLLGDVRERNINQQRGKLGSLLPQDFANQWIGDTADDTYLNDILGTQYNDAQSYLQRAMDRGTLSDVGYNEALNELNTTRTGAMSRLQDTGSGILEGFRNELRGIGERGYQAAGQYDFANPSFNAKSYLNEATGRKNEMLGGLEGSLRSAIGGEQFFNPSSLIVTGGQRQGLYNPVGTGGENPNALLSAMSKRSTSEDERRGLGTQGSF